MLLEPQETEVKITKVNQYWYESHGYVTTLNKTIKIDVKDLQHGSHQKVKTICDYCGDIVLKEYRVYLNQLKQSPIKKNTCKKCSAKKTIESNQLVYGVPFANQRKEVLEKRFSTNIEKYGNKSPLGCEEILEKSKATSRRKFGADYYMQTKEYKDRVKESNQKKYGYDHMFQSPEVKENIKKVLLDRYGVEYITQSKDIQSIIKETTLKKYGYDCFLNVPSERIKHQIKARETMYKNKTAPTSSQQNFMHIIVGGCLNYPVYSLSLDIAFPEEKIYIEYNGSGHALSVVFGNHSLEEFKIKERKRYYFLKNRGWKSIVITSIKDKLPSEKSILELIRTSKQFLREGYNWVEINIDEGKLKTKNREIEFDNTCLMGRKKIKTLIKKYGE